MPRGTRGSASSSACKYIEQVPLFCAIFTADLSPSTTAAGEGNGNPLQYSCLENPMDRGTWWATVHRVAKSRTRLSDSAQHVTKSYIFNSFQPKSHFIQGTFPRPLVQDLPTSEHFLSSCLTAPWTLVRFLGSLILLEEELIKGRSYVWKHSSHPPARSLRLW